MKISEVGNAGWVQKGGKEHAAQKEQGHFKSVLDEAMGADRADQAVSAAPAPAPMGPVMLEGVAAARGADPAQEKTLVVRHLQETLDLVDFYGGRLADPAVPAQDLEPLVDRLEEQVLELERLGAGCESGELVDLVKDLSVTIGAEIAKYRRGDYV